MLDRASLVSQVAQDRQALVVQGLRRKKVALLAGQHSCPIECLCA
jgi:hypothetical protein